MATQLVGSPQGTTAPGVENELTQAQEDALAAIGSLGNNAVIYTNGSGVITSSSDFTYDGNKLKIAATDTFYIGDVAAIFIDGGGNFNFGSNTPANDTDGINVGLGAQEGGEVTSGNGRPGGFAYITGGAGSDAFGGSGGAGGDGGNTYNFPGAGGSGDGAGANGDDGIAYINYNPVADAAVGQAYIYSGLRVAVTTVNAATYDLLKTDNILNVTYTSTGAVTSLTLPTAQTVIGRIITVKDAGGNANTNNITIDTEGSETIDGQSTLVINSDYGSVELYSDGSNWFVKNSL